MNNIDYWQGFQDALNLAEYELKKTKGGPLGNLSSCDYQTNHTEEDK